MWDLQIYIHDFFDMTTFYLLQAQYIYIYARMCIYIYTAMDTSLSTPSPDRFEHNTNIMVNVVDETAYLGPDETQLVQ